MPTPSLLQRLKERKLVQWALAYLCGAWVLVEATGHVVAQFQWPPIIGQVVTIIAFFGFFVVLVIAWYHGEKGRQWVSGPELLIIALLLLISGGVLSTIGGGEEAREQPDLSASVGEEELNKSIDQDVRDLAAGQDVALGIGTYGETRWGQGAYASDEDVGQQAAILAILTSSGAGEAKMRNDARHLQTAMRYGVDKFITRDHGILNKAEALAAEFGLKVMEPESAALLVLKRA